MSPHRILFVDDDANLLAAFQRTLRRQFNIETALGGQEALEHLQTSADYAVVVADMRMPGMDGVELLEKVRQLAPHAIRMMLTGNADQQTAVDAVNRGHVYRFLNKPCPPETLIPALEDALNQFELRRVERELLEGTLIGSVKMLSEVLGMVAPEALGHGQRLRESIRRFATVVGAAPLWEMEVGALLASIGCASLPARLLQKMNVGSDLTQEETAVVRRVPQIGHDLLVGIPRLAGVARIVLYQNQSFDGSGFPSDDCAGEMLPVGARMLKILNDRMALEADGIVKQRAFDAMRMKAGVYDPKLLEICFECFQSFLAQAVSSERQVHSLLIKDLAIDQVVVSNITTRDGHVLVGAGSRLTAMVLKRLANYDELGDVKQPVFVQDPEPIRAAAELSVPAVR
jgi:response regulator RpfG family c-di-GMP phosphodiesterase